jgi:hypothetical protein
VRVILLLVLAVTFYGYDPAAQLFGATPQRWGYVLHGFGGMVLALLVALACTDWVSRCIALWIAFEEFLIGACGAMGLYSELPWVQPYTGLCGPAVGIDTYLAGVFAVAVFSLILAKLHKRQEK